MGVRIRESDLISDLLPFRYRFMAMDRLGSDLQKVFEQSGGRMKKPTVLLLGQTLVRSDAGWLFKQHSLQPAASSPFSCLVSQLNVLEYIHDNEYVHADIKAANLMLGYRNPEEASSHCSAEISFSVFNFNPVVTFKFHRIKSSRRILSIL